MLGQIKYNIIYSIKLKVIGIRQLASFHSFCHRHFLIKIQEIRYYSWDSLSLDCKRVREEKAYSKGIRIY